MGWVLVAKRPSGPDPVQNNTRAKPGWYKAVLSIFVGVRVGTDVGVTATERGEK